MRLDARKGDTGWTVWHVPKCRIVNLVVFVDDTTAVWGEYPTADVLHRLLSCMSPGADLPVIEHQATKIQIIPARRLVLIDPIEDDDEEPEAITTESTVTEGEPA